jgi:hypothetical protein
MGQGGWGLILSLMLVLTFVLIAGQPALGQSAGSTSSAITGKITDEQGAVIPGASVKARNIENNFIRGAIAGEDGSFLVSQLPPGTYEVTVSAEGFTTRVSKLELVLGTTNLFDCSMKLGETSEIIEVTAGNTVQEGKSESSTNVDRGRIDGLPINRRSFLDFSLTAARVTSDRLPAQGAAVSSGLSFNGQTARFNNITIDGLDNNDNGPGTVRSTYSQDAVQEFQIISDSFSAEFGRAVAGVVNIVTKGGSNGFHGSLFFFNRNDSISARDVFAPIEPPYKQYQFGAVLGGHIKRDKLFYFASFERLSVKQNSFVTIGNETVESARRLNFPLRNGPSAFALDSTSFLGRVDARLGTNDSLWLRYNYSGSFNGAFEPFGGLVAESNAGVQKLKEDTVAASNTYISTSLNLVNETRFLFSQREQRVSPLDGGPQVRIVGAEGLVTFGRGSILPQMRQQPTYQIVDNVSLARGRNQFKLGIDFFYRPSDKATLPVFPGGFALFTPFDFSAIFGIPGLPSFTGLQAFDPSLRTPFQRLFLQGLAAQLPGFFPGFPQGFPVGDVPLPAAFIQGFGETLSEITEKDFSAYFQDDIKVRPNLLVKLGLRYDINRISFIPNNNGNLSPRVAVVYRPSRLDNLNIRAAYGIFFGRPLIGGIFASQPTVSGRFKIAVVPFPFSLLAFSQPGRRFPESKEVPPQVTFIPQLSQTFPFDPNTRNSYSQQATLGLDYLLSNNTIASVSYQFVRGVKLFSLRNINPIVRPNPSNPVLGAITGRVDPTKGDVIELETAFDSYYNAVTFAISRRLSNRFGLLAHYTFSKAIDNFVDVRPDVLETADPMNLRGERGLSLQDVRSRFVASGTWELSYTKNPLLRDFQLSAILNINSGRPYNLLAGVDLNRNGDNPPGDRPAGLGRNVGITPGYANLDLRLTRTISFGENVRFNGFVEVFNLFNRVNISDIDRIFPPDAQGRFNLPEQDGGRFIAPRERYRNAFAPRQFQLGFRLTF